MQTNTSDRLHIIDRETFDKIVTTASTSKQKPIRNSKYKRTRTDFNLFSFLTEATRLQPQKKRKKLQCPRLAINKRYEPKRLKKRGKVRENKWKPNSRIKKVILKHRKAKQLKQAQIEIKLNDTTDVASAFSVTSESQHSQADNSQLVTTYAPTNISPANKLFSRRFRSYCENFTTPHLKELTDRLLRDLYRFQKRAYTQNAIKALAHRRFVVGLREVQSYLAINKVKLVIIAPDIESCAAEGGLDDTIETIKQCCRTQQTPYAFSLQRRQLSYSLIKKVPVSCVGILDYDGARDTFFEFLTELTRARQAFAEETAAQKKTEKHELNGLARRLASINIGH